ncbi:hypothetical protein [Pontiella agarivorans]|uniref:Uncharacterized protein n=1 Tax=Pontiella agarivorans TaxID=3038953 RepID=A0ABU5MTN3_9BACT|nr:hypothetical protein [Pontiella agarivorans]MDZ8117567.1 hypothetical protein [Pontiella agarivorans]
MKRQLITAAWGIALAFSVSAEAITYEFAQVEGFTNGVLSGQAGWSGEAYSVNTNDSGSIMIDNDPAQQWVAAFPTESFDAESNNCFFVSNVVSWTQVETNGDNSIFNVIINDSKSGGTPCRLSLERRANFPQYVLNLKSDDGSNNGWNFFPENLFGVNGSADPDSDEIGFGFSLTKGRVQNEWMYSITLENITSNSILYALSGSMTSTSNLYDSAVLYAGISSGISSEINGTSNRVIKSFSMDQSYINYDIIFDIDFQDMLGPIWNQYHTAPLRAWVYGHITTNGNGVADPSDRYLEHRPGFSTNNAAWAGDRDQVRRGMLFTNSIPEMDISDMYEFSMDYRMFAENSVTDQKFVDVILTTNNYTGNWGTPSSEQCFGQGAEGLDPAIGAYQLGFRLEQDNWTGVGGAWPDGGMKIRLNPVNAEAHAGVINLNDLGITNITDVAGDSESDTLHLRYVAEKTTNVNVWACSLTVSNPVNQLSWTFSEDLTNAIVYEAADLYLGLASRDGFDGIAGYELDNLYSRIVNGTYVPVIDWSYALWADEKGVTGTATEDDDGDGLNNYGEYVFGGDPVPPNGSGDQGISPVFNVESGAYIFSLVGDDTVVAHVLSTDNLIIDSWETNETVRVAETDGLMYAYTNLNGTAAERKFLKVEVE